MKTKVGQIWEHCINNNSSSSFDWSKSAIFEIVKMTEYGGLYTDCKVITSTLGHRSKSDFFSISFDPCQYPNWRPVSSLGWVCAKCKQEHPNIATIFPRSESWFSINYPVNYLKTCWKCTL